jgi:hypothetical protein
MRHGQQFEAELVVAEDLAGLKVKAQAQTVHTALNRAALRGAAQAQTAALRRQRPQALPDPGGMAGFERADRHRGRPAPKQARKNPAGLDVPR